MVSYSDYIKSQILLLRLLNNHVLCVLLTYTVWDFWQKTLYIIPKS